MTASGKSSLSFYNGNWLWLGLMVIDIFIIISNSSMLNSYQMPNKNNLLYIVLSVINMQFMTLSYFCYPWCTHILKYTDINRILYRILLQFQVHVKSQTHKYQPSHMYLSLKKAHLPHMSKGDRVCNLFYRRERHWYFSLLVCC